MKKLVSIILLVSFCLPIFAYITLTINGTNFNFPETGDESWGDSVTSWAQSVSSGLLQKSGGSFTLLNEVDFGASYGIKGLYFKSRSSNIGSTGIFRLANADSIVWRNAGNSGDLSLLPSTNTALKFAGIEIVNLTNSQTLTNKTLTAPILNNPTINGGSFDNGTFNTSTLVSATVQDQIYIKDPAGSNVVTVKAPTGLASSYTITLPATGGNNKDTLHTDGTGSSYFGPVVLTSDVSGVLPIANGGTNSSVALTNARLMWSSSGQIVEAPQLTNGQLFIGSTAAFPVASTLTGTTNQISVANGSGSITLSTPQDLQTSSNVTFGSATLSTPLSVASGGTGLSSLSTNKIPYASGTNSIGFSSSSITELNYLQGVTSNVQTQIDSKVFTTSLPTIATGNVFVGNGTRFATSDTGFVYDIANKRVGINSPTPANDLEIGAGTGTRIVQINGSGTTYSALTFGDNSTRGWQIGADHNNGLGLGTDTLYFYANRTGTAGNKMALTQSGDLLPQGNLTQDLGSSSHSWRTAYASNIVSGSMSLSAPLPIASGGTNSGAALNNNRIMVSNGGAIVENYAIPVNRALISDASGFPTASITTTTELGYVSGATSSIQGQLDSKVFLTRNINTTAPLSGGGDLSADRTISMSQAGAASSGWLSSTDWNTFNNKMDHDPFIDSMTTSSLATTGLLTKTSATTSTTRTITAGSTKLSVSNGDGVAANPTLDVVPSNIDRNTLGGSPLTVANGGTGASSWSTGQVLYGQGGAIVSSPNLTFTGSRLGVNKSNPQFLFDGTSSTADYINIAAPAASQKGFGISDTDDANSWIMAKSSGSTDLRFNSNGSDKFYFQTAGYLGINVSPSFPLDVKDNGSSGSIANFSQSGTIQIGLNVGRTSGTVASWTQYIPSGSTDYRLYSGGDKFIFQTTGTFAPAGNGTQNLGGSSNFWNTSYQSNAYVSKLLHLEDPGAGTNMVMMQAPTLSADYTLTWPTSAGTSGYVLSTDGTGILSWVNTTGGANTALSNLAATAINSSLLPGTDLAITLGSTSKRYTSVYANDFVAAGSVQPQTNNAADVGTTTVRFKNGYINTLHTNVATKTTTYTTVNGDSTIIADASGGAFTITLITCDSTMLGMKQDFHKKDNSVNAVTLAGGGADLINGNSSMLLEIQDDQASLQCDGAGNWLLF